MKKGKKRKKGGGSVSGRNVPAFWGTKPTRIPSSPLKM